MPKGIYIDALELGPRELAKQMNDIILDKARYCDFFRWHGYYSFHDTADHLHHDAICGLCALLNDQTRRNVYTHLTKWWNVLGAQHLADVDLYLIPPDDMWKRSSREVMASPISVAKKYCISTNTFINFLTRRNLDLVIFCWSKAYESTIMMCNNFREKKYSEHMKVTSFKESQRSEINEAFSNYEYVCIFL